MKIELIRSYEEINTDPGKVETIDNLWNPEKQISSLLNYSKFLTSESPSSKKAKFHLK